MVSDNWIGDSLDLVLVLWDIFWTGFITFILPAITYALLGTTWIVQYLRNEVIDAKNLDYVKTAKSKGVPEN